MRVKLICPPIVGLNNHWLARLPYGLGVLANFLRKNGFLVDLYDFNTPFKRLGVSKLYKEIAKYYQYQTNAGRYLGLSDRRSNLLADSLINLTDVRNFDFVGIGIDNASQILTALLLAEKIKKTYGIPVVLGGPYVTLHADLFFEKYNFIDYAIVGEGEVPLLRLIKFIEGKEDINNVPSLWYRNGSQSIFNKRSFYNIEDQSCPDYDDLSLELYTSPCRGQKVIFIPYSTSRGCTNKCAFCNYHTIDGPWQTKSIGKVISDITLLKRKYKSSYFGFADTTFNISYKYVEKFCDALINTGLNIYWWTMVQPKNMDRTLISKMKKAGCIALCWGIESASKRVLQLMKKDANIEDQITVLKKVKEAGMRNVIFLIVRYPYETKQDLEETALYLKNNAAIIDEVLVFQLGIIYRSFLFNNPKEVKIKLKERKDTFFTYYYNYEEIEGNKSKIYRKELKMLRMKIVSNYYRYIYPKRFKFPYNMIVKFFGIIILTLPIRQSIILRPQENSFKKKIYDFIRNSLRYLKVC